MSDHGLLRPGSHRGRGLTDDAAFVQALVDVETAWAQVLGGDVVLDAGLDLVAIAGAGERVGNPVVPVLDALREQTDATLHRGLTSQDSLDTALVLLARRVRQRVLDDANGLCIALRALALAHRDTVMVGRTLTQTAVPITFGLKAAQWLAGVDEAARELAGLALPVQCGGAAGTLSLVADPDAAVRDFAARLDLAVPLLPWHTRRRPITAIADCLTTLLDALGTMAADVALLSRPEIGELSEGTGGGSSTMPHKHNPVLSVLVRAAALQAPALAAGLHTAAGQMIDERPDGAWHAQWPLLRDVLSLAVIATSQARDLIEGLVVHADVMRARAQASVADLLAEKYGAGRVPADAAADEYLGQAGVFVDAVLAHTVPAAPRIGLTPLNVPGRGDVLFVGAGLGTRASTLWAQVVPLLPGVEVIGVDLPGHGAAPPTHAEFTVADLAESLRQAASPYVQRGQRVFYAGVSLAGAVALELALRPGPFTAVAAIASASRLGQPQAWRERAELVSRAGTSVMVAGSAARWFAPGFSAQAPQTVGAMLDDLVEVDDGSYALCCQALATFDLRGQLVRSQVPALLIPGELDEVVSVAAAEADLAQMPGAGLRIATAAAHQPPVEAAEPVAQFLRELMEVTW